MKNSGVEWIGEIPDEWNVTRSKNIFTQRSSRGNDVEEQLAATQQHGMYPQKLLEGVVQVKEDTDLQQFKTVHKNDYVISLRSFQGGFEMSDYEGVCSPAYQVFYNTIPISYRYYKYLFKSDGFISKMNSLTVGIREGKNIQYKDFSNSPIIIPPKSTQQRIASYLDKKCSKIEETIQNQQQVIEKLKAYKQSLITEAVTGKIKIQNGKVCGKYENYKDSGVEWIGKIPSGWETIKIKWLLNERKERSEEGKEEPLSMSQKYGLIPTKEMESIPNMASTFVGSKLTYKDDIVFNKLKAHLGVFSVSKYDGLVSPDYAVYTSTGKADLKYLEYLFKTPQCISEFRKRSTGVGEGLTRLYTGELFSIYIPFPEKKEQENIANILVSTCTAIDSAIEQKQNLIEKLTEYKKSLIYECVTGKKEI